MTTYASILDWEIPWTEEPSGLQSMGSQRVGHNCVTKHSTVFKDTLQKTRISHLFKSLHAFLIFVSSGIYATKNILFLSSAIPLGFLTGVTWLSCTMPQPRGQFCLTISL